MSINHYDTFIKHEVCLRAAAGLKWCVALGQVSGESRTDAALRTRYLECMNASHVEL